MSSVLRFSSNPNSQLNYIQESNISSGATQADLLDQRGNIYLDQGKFDEALDCFQEALTIRQRLYGYYANEKMAQSYTNLGRTYYQMGGRYDEQSLLAHRRAYDLLRSLPIRNYSLESDSLGRLGVVYRRMGKYNEALQFIKLSLEWRNRIYSSISDYEGRRGIELKIATSYYDLGLTYYDLGNYDLARTYHIKALEIRRKYLMTENQDRVASERAVTYLSRKLGYTNYSYNADY